jgi:hypothetical protein
MSAKLPVVIVVVLASAPAYAQHDHGADEPVDHDDHHHHHGHERPYVVSAGLALVAASFDTMAYSGNYQGVVPTVRWSNERFAALASGAVYRVAENGAEFYGLGDAGVHGQARLVAADGFDAGVSAGVSFPTGDERHGMGMGHVMVMPGLFASWAAAARVRFASSIGYSRALGSADGHDHGAWPLVSPMLMAEVSWNAGADVRLPHHVTAGARASGGLPAGEGGAARAMVAGRIAWHQGTLDSSVELQAGVVGDPFNVRGVVSTTVSF